MIFSTQTLLQKMIRLTCLAPPLLIILTVAFQVCASWQTAGSVTRVTRSKTNGIVLDTSSRAKVLVEFFDIDVIRIRIAPSGVFEKDFSYALDYSVDRHTPVSTHAQNASEITLTGYSGSKIVIKR